MSVDVGVEGRGGLASAWRTITLVVMALLGVAVSAALVITVGEANRQRDRALALQAHSYDVMVLSRTLQGSIARSEASLGRYVISGDQSLGQLYYDDWRRADEAINRLEKLVHDNAGQARRVGALRAAYDARGRELALTALNTNYGKNGQALARYYQLRKAPSLATINATLDAVIGAERALLRERTAEVMTSIGRSTGAAKWLSVFGVLLVLGMIALGWAVMQVSTDRALARREADEERERADDLALAVEEATASLREQEARLRQVQKMEAVGQLTGGIAHDFNNMLAVILGGLELARRNVTDSEAVARHIDSAEEGARRAAALTGHLLAFSRETAINPECIGVADLFRGLGELLDRTLGDGVTLVFHNDSRGWCTRADRVQLENTLVNLAVNARDAMESRGTLTIAATNRSLASAEGACEPGDYLVLTVTDTGAGMTPEVLERVFEPFFTTKPVGKGTGLGLSQIFGFTRQIGGDVTIRSAPGLGTAVTLLLPRDAAAEATASAPVASVATTLPVATMPDDSLHILVVEDDPRVLAATIGALEEIGHRPEPCDDPQGVAGALARMDRVDLILSDVLMPGVTGPEMVAALPLAFQHLPVLFVTGYAGDTDRALDLGGRPVLRKPFTLAALEHAVAAASRPDGRDTAERIAAE